LLASAWRATLLSSSPAWGSLDLWGTQLVVLSACDTGRGDVKLGQGVYGLRRAFLVAGAETVVMSLWKVNDETTRTLMETYYRHLLAGQGRATALREAMRELRRTQSPPLLGALHRHGPRDAPAPARVQRPGGTLIRRVASGRSRATAEPTP
jgi:CHAT domain-containing protein